MSHPPADETFPIRIGCPHCQNPIELAEPPQAGETTCPACGSTFKIDGERTESWSPQQLPTLGRFELLEDVGHGAFGTVYKARDTSLDRIVAVKVPRSGRFAAKEDEDRFVREARSAAQLDHPGIVRIYEVGRGESFPYIVSQFVDGLTLADHLSAGGRYSIKAAAQLVAEVADALDHAHGHGVVHRDLKPSNIILASQPGPAHPQLMDFGLALRDEGEVTVTRDGQVLGTPAYMSPEQARGEGHRVDGRSDVYGLGVILYELLCGELPFRGNSRMLLHQVLHEEPRSPRRLNDRIPRDAETICLKCLQKDPQNRYTTAQALADDLRRFGAGEPILARPVGRPQRLWRWCRRNPAIASLAATAMLLLAAVAAVATVGYIETSQALALSRQAEEKEHRARQEASDHFQMAMDAVDEMLTVLGQDGLRNVPYVEPIRQELLEKALHFYEELRRQKPTDAQARAEVARAYHRLGHIHLMLGQHDQAHHAYMTAIDRFEKLANERPDLPGHHHHLAISYDYLGELKRTVGKTEEAEKFYRMGLERQRKLVAQGYANRDYRQELARTLNNLGILLKDTHRHDEAKDSFGQAIQLLEGLVDELPGEPEYRQEAARTYINLGILHKQTGRSRDAETAYGQALDRLQRMTDASPEVHDYRYKLAVCHMDLANLLRTDPDRHSDAQSHYETACKTLRALTGDFPRIPLYRKELANSLNGLAGLLAVTARHDAARATWADSAETFRQLVDQYPDVADYQSLWALVLGGQAWLEQQSGHADAALALVQSAVQQQARAYQLSPQTPDYRQRLCEHWLFQADLMAARKDPSGAIEALRQAAELGNLDPNQIATRPGLAPLQDHAELKQFIHQLRRTRSAETNPTAE